MLLLAVMCLLALTAAQPYVPQANRLSQCAAGQGQVIHYGNDDASLLTDQFGSVSASNLYATTVNVTHTGVTIHQLSIGLLNNDRVTSPIHFRLGLMYFNGNSGKMIAQTDEISLFPSPAQIVYADLLESISLPVGSYQVIIMADRNINTGSNEASGSFDSTWSYYSPYSLPESDVTYTQSLGGRAVAVHGCQSDVDPFTAPGVVAHSFCSTVQNILPAVDSTSTRSYATTISVRISGVVAMLSAQTGSNTLGTWYQASAAQVTVVTTTSGQQLYSEASVVTRRLTLSPVTASRSQKFYPSSASIVDAEGLVFTDVDGTQVTLRHVNGLYQVDEAAQSVRGTYVSALLVRPGTTIPTCSSVPAYTPDDFSCPAGSQVVKLGDTDRAWRSLVTSPDSYSVMEGNWMYFHRFTVRTALFEVRQLTVMAMDNSQRIIRMRLGLFESTSANESVTQKLVAQTREVVLNGVSKQLIAVNLQTSYTLTLGLNYSVGIITDQPFRTTSANFASLGSQSVQPYDYYFRSGTGLPSTITPNVVSEQVQPLGIRACAQQTTRQFSICAAFIHESDTVVYSGTLTALATPQTNAKGTFVPVIGGSGTLSQQYTYMSEPQMFNWTYGKFNLPSNDLIYIDNTNGGVPIDVSGLQVVVDQEWNQQATQIASFYDPVSGSWEFTIVNQYQWGTYAQFPKNLINTLSIQPYNGGALPVCNAPPRPINMVFPNSPVITCPVALYQIQETYGDVEIGNYQVRDDGTTINANRIYTHRFVPQSTSSVAQLAVGLLRNVDRVGRIKARVGLYSSTFQLLGQATQLEMEEAIDQMVVLELETPITLQGGSTYYLALVADSLLEVATSATADSPSMLFTLGEDGLPQTLTSTGNAVTVSIAAFACVQTTHSFCAWNQYDGGAGDSITDMYTGLLQVSPSTASDAYGTYQTIWAAGGYVSRYERYGWGVNPSVAKPFSMPASRDFHLYLSSANNQRLDTTGLQLLTDNVDIISLAYSATRDAITDLAVEASGRRYISSGFHVAPLGGGVPSCKLSSIPPIPQPAKPAPACPSGSSAVSFGTARESDLEHSNEGDLSLYRDTAYSRKITTSETAVMLHQIKFGTNYNFNTVNKMKFALFDAKMNFMATTEVVTMINPTNKGVLTGVLSTPQYLAPNSVYYMSALSQYTVYAAQGAKTAPQFYLEFSSDFPATITNTYDSGEIALQGVGCTTTTIEPTATTHSSKSGVSDGAIAGIVIGCVIGTNLLLLACLWLFCFSAGAATAKSTRFNDESQMESSRVEMHETRA